MYGADPARSPAARRAARRRADNRAAAKAIAALRKPTRAAWVVNRLARTDFRAPPRLTELATALGAAQGPRTAPGCASFPPSAGRWSTRSRRGPWPRPAWPTRRRPAAGGQDTLTAALADPAIATAFAAGALTKAAQWSGFGYADLAPADDPAPSHLQCPGLRQRHGPAKRLA